MNDFEDDLLERLKDPEYAVVYIESALEENDPDFLQVALGDVIKAHGVSKVSEITGLTRQAIYHIVSKNGNPSIRNINKLLNSVGLEIEIKVKSA